MSDAKTLHFAHHIPTEPLQIYVSTRSKIDLPLVVARLKMFLKYRTTEFFAEFNLFMGWRSTYQLTKNYNVFSHDTLKCSLRVQLKEVRHKTIRQNQKPVEK